MLDQTFDYIWDNIVFPMSERLKKHILEKDANANFSICNLPQDKDNVKKMYTETRDTLKQLYHYNNLDKVRKIDIHKVAACFACIIMQYKIYKFEIDEETSDDVFLSNARLAYNVSLAIIKDNLVHKYSKNKEILNDLLCEDLRMPKTTDGHDRFSLGRAKTLALNDIFLDKFDILSYSDMLYWIELFNIMILENKAAIDCIDVLPEN